MALGIRHVLCVPLRLVRYLDRAEAVGEERRIGVLYLDNREKGHAALELHSRGARDARDRGRCRHRERAALSRDDGEGADGAGDADRGGDPAGAAPEGRPKSACSSRPRRHRCRADRSAATSTTTSTCRTASLGFALGDVAGKGPPAALLSAMMQGIFAAQAASSDPPSQTVSRVNLALYRRGIESRFVTLMYGALYPDGRLQYCNAGHNPPLVVGPTDFRRLERGGPIVGLFEGATYEEETVTLTVGDWLIVYSDGVSEALSAEGEEYGEARILTCVRKNLDMEPQALLESLFADVRDFARGAAQSDDITAMVLRFR